MRVFSNQGRRYDLDNNLYTYTVYAKKDGTIINHTCGSERHADAISEAIRTYHTS